MIFISSSSSLFILILLLLILFLSFLFSKIYCRSWDHHDILSVLPEYNLTSHCSTSARLRSIAPFSGRKETAVYAADVHSGIVIRCKVFIDNISRIQIFHNSIKLDLDGLATLRVRAFDIEGASYANPYIWNVELMVTYGSMLNFHLFVCLIL